MTIVIILLLVAILLSQNKFFIWNFFARRVTFLPEISIPDNQKNGNCKCDASLLRDVPTLTVDKFEAIVPKYDNELKSLDDKIGTLPDLVAERVMARFDLEPLEKMVKELKKQG